MIGVLINAIIVLVVLGLLFWLVTYLLSLFPLPDPFPRAIQALFAIVAVLIVISVLTGWGGETLPWRWRYG